MEDGAKENTALNIQKPLEILVTDEDKHGTDIAYIVKNIKDNLSPF